MITKCAMCEVNRMETILGDDGKNDGIVSHGLCPAHATAFWAEYYEDYLRRHPEEANRGNPHPAA